MSEEQDPKKLAEQLSGQDPPTVPPSAEEVDEIDSETPAEIDPAGAKEADDGLSQPELPGFETPTQEGKDGTDQEQNSDQADGAATEPSSESGSLGDDTESPAGSDTSFPILSADAPTDGATESESADSDHSAEPDSSEHGDNDADSGVDLASDHSASGFDSPADADSGSAAGASEALEDSDDDATDDASKPSEPYSCVRDTFAEFHRLLETESLEAVVGAANQSWKALNALRDLRQAGHLDGDEAATADYLLSIGPLWLSALERVVERVF